MKTKLTKIWGIGLVVVLLAMLIGAAIPVSAATLAWSPVTTPNPIKQQLQAGSNVNAFAVAPDGTTMFAYDNSALGVLYKSLDGGLTWTGTGIGGNLNGATVVDMAVSPDYATDSTVVAVSPGTVYRSINGGKSFGTVGAATLTLVGVITSVDVTSWYLGGLAILVGDSNSLVLPPAPRGDAHLFTTSSLSWTPEGLTQDVIAVAFSPNHPADAQYLALTVDGVGASVNTRLRARFGTAAWDLGILPALIYTSTTAAPTGGAIAFPDDYEWSSNNRILVGTTGGDGDDVYRVHGGLPGGASLKYDLNVGGTGTETEVFSIAVKGNIAEADVLVGQVGSAVIKRCHDPTTSTITWRSSTKSPTGDSDAIVAWSPTTDDAYAATNGVASALSRSTDGGVTWNQLSLIDVSALANMVLVDFAAPDASALYLLMWDDTGPTGVIATGDYTMLFKSTNGGTSWEQIWTHRSVGTEGMTILTPSPDYATDETLYVAQAAYRGTPGDTRLWKTTNSGETFIGLTAPAAITAIGVVDKDTYYTGASTRLYKSGRWTAATGIGGTVLSIVIADDGTIFIGDNAGNVQQSTDDGKSFTTLGAGGQLGTNVIVALDPNYASNNFVYAGSSTGAIGVNRWEVGTSSAWKQLDDDDDLLACTGLVLSADGSLYAASSQAYDPSTAATAPDGAVRRTVGPQGPSAAAWNFETMGTDLTISATLDTLAYASGSNALYAIASNVTPGSYLYGYRLFAFTDNLAVSPELSSPKDGTATPGTSVTFGWKGITSPVSLTYEVAVSTDSKFAVAHANTPVTVIKSGTGVTVTGFTPGTKYYWKVYATKPLSSKDSAVWTFTPKLSATETTALTTSPAPGAVDVSLRPTFQWGSVPGATSYEMELADNPFFANASVKKPLTHTVWTWDTDLDYSTTYYWRARAVKSGRGILTNYGPWSEATFQTMAKPVPPTPTVIPPPQITVQPAPPAPPPVVQIPPAPPSPVTPAVIWAIIIIGAVLVIAVIVLIVRTRRVP